MKMSRVPFMPEPGSKPSHGTDLVTIRDERANKRV